jgi:hypothetical protein
MGRKVVGYADITHTYRFHDMATMSGPLFLREHFVL